MSDIKIGIIGGSGLGTVLSSEGTRHEIDTPFGKPSDAIIETSWNNLPIFLLSRHGPGHLLNPTQVPYRANIFAMKKLGCTHIIASGAVGSLREEFKPKDLVIPEQIIDKTFKRDATFFDNAAVHVEFAEPFCQMLRQILIEAGATHNRGCYIAMEGPAFSTRAESLMHRLWGGDLIGMTAMPEAKLAREAEIAYALVALVTDYDSWRPIPAATPEKPKPDAATLLKEIIANLQTATDNAIALIKKAVEIIASKSPEQLASPAHQALRLAIWSQNSKIPAEEVQRLSPLWVKYLQQ
jgi:5'-methylthioadenosine phosphorylase